MAEINLLGSVVFAPALNAPGTDVSVATFKPGLFLPNTCGCIVLTAVLNDLAIWTGLINIFPVAIVVTAPDEKFLAWVKGPNTVLPACTNPLGTNTAAWYHKGITFLSNAPLAP